MESTNNAHQIELEADAGPARGGRRLRLLILRGDKARVGARIPVAIQTEKDAKVFKRTLTLRKAKAGDASGKPLGC